VGQASARSDQSSEAGSDALGGLKAHENETAGRHLELSDPGSHDGGSRRGWAGSRGETRANSLSVISLV
jgi:hypothetical protein